MSLNIVSSSAMHNFPKKSSNKGALAAFRLSIALCLRAQAMLQITRALCMNPLWQGASAVDVSRVLVAVCLRACVFACDQAPSDAEWWYNAVDSVTRSRKGCTRRMWYASYSKLRETHLCCACIIRPFTVYPVHTTHILKAFNQI